MNTKFSNRLSRTLQFKSRLIICCVCFTLIVLAGCRTGKVENGKDSSQWDKLGPGGGGSTFIPTFSRHTPETFLVRCDMTGSYLTHDGGDSYNQINLPGGASSFAFDPLDSNTVYIGSSALHRSVDGGKTWEQIFPAKTEVVQEIYRSDHADYSIETTDSSSYAGEAGSIDAIRPDPVKKRSVWFSMGSSLFCPVDEGLNWQRIILPQEIEYLYTNPTTLKDQLFLFTAEAVHVLDKTSLEIRSIKLPEAMSPAFSFTGGTLKNDEKVFFYALHHDQKENITDEFGHSELWISEDQGETWKRVLHPAITNEIAGVKPSYSMISCAEHDAGTAYLICNRYEERKKDKGYIYWYGALKTSDSGKNWDWVWKGGGGSGQYGVKDGIGVSNLKDAWAEKAFGGEYIRLMDVGVYPSEGDIAVVTDWYRTMKTMDGGITWREVYSAEQPDGTFISRGLDVTTCYGIHFDPFDSNHIAISYTDIGYHHSFNRGASWIRSTEGVPAEWVNTCYWLVFDPDIKDKVWSVWSYLHDFPRGKMTRNPLWKEYGEGGVCISENGGRTWKSSCDGMGFNSPATCIVLDPASPPGNRTLYASVFSKGVFKSTDDGKTWQLKNNGLEENTCAFELTLTGKGVLFLTVSITPAHAGGKKGKEFYSGAVYRSTDGAESWTKLTVTDGPLFPNGIDYDRTDPDRIYLGCWADIYLSDLVDRDVVNASGGDKLIEMPGGIFLSEDGGDTWRSIFDEDQYVYDITADPWHPGRFYCNTFNGAAWRSDDHGNTWKKIKGYDFHWGHRIIVDPNNPEMVYITTFGSSIWHGYTETE
jgi:photosystem II stability/assembly factor-like uncharacterized protein